jgi:hypothetical protein
MNFVGPYEQDFCYLFSRKSVSQGLAFLTVFYYKILQIFEFLNSNQPVFGKLKKSD